jgi:16S rRNA (uracil1498-N3)-methyltransferase
MVSAVMPRDRFFVARAAVAGDRVELAPDDARKLVTVLRRKSGDAVRVVDARGVEFSARLDVAGGAVHALLDAAAEAAVTSETAARIVLAQAIPKGQKMDFIVEKATELGAWAIVPLRSARVVGERTGDHKHERWQRIAKSAAQQAGRTRVPEVAPTADWPALRATFAVYDQVYLAWERAAAVPLREPVASGATPAAAILIVIGPEGGFTDAEVSDAVAGGALAVSLGPRILRTETAALVVLAALLYARGEL